MRRGKRSNLIGKLAVGAACVVLPTAVAIADTYRWVDKDGTVNFSDSLQKVPSQYRDSAKQLEKAGKASPKSPQTAPSPPPPAYLNPSVNTDAQYQVWRDRLRVAREELDQLKAQREKVQKDYETFIGEYRMRTFADPQAEAKYRASLANLDEKILHKEEEISTTIPDQARQAGIPPSVLNQ